MFETNKGNFSGSKPIIGRRITFNPEEIGAFGLEQFVYILYDKECIFQKNIILTLNQPTVCKKIVRHQQGPISLD